MKKFLTLLLLFSTVLSCSDDNGGKPEPKAATRVYFEDWENTRVGYVDLENTGEYMPLTQAGTEKTNVIAIDKKNNTIYIVQQQIHQIKKMILDPAGTLETVYDEDDGIQQPTSLVVNGDYLYWADSGTGKIMRGDLSGSQTPVALYDGAIVLDHSYGLDIDKRNNKLYFTDFSGTEFNGIWAANLNGSGTPTKLFVTAESIDSPSGIVVDIKSGKLYWTDEWESTISVGDKKGTGNPTILFGPEDGLNRTDGIAIDHVSKKIYWSESGNDVIARGNLDGTGEREVILTDCDCYNIRLY